MMPHWEAIALVTIAVFLSLVLAILVFWHAWTRYRQWRAVPKGYFGRVYGNEARANVRRG